MFREFGSAFVWASVEDEMSSWRRFTLLQPTGGLSDYDGIMVDHECRHRQDDFAASSSSHIKEDTKLDVCTVHKTCVITQSRANSAIIACV